MGQISFYRPAGKEIANKLGHSGQFELVLKGHGFSRAENYLKVSWALASEGLVFQTDHYQLGVQPFRIAIGCLGS
jgi:hypothetical protein